MNYRITYEHPHHHLITIEFEANDLSEWQHDVVCILPKWRPGRYELANYAKNVYRLDAWNGENEDLPVRKTDTGTWVIEKGKATKVRGRYTYRAKQMDAGGSWVDENLFYVSPVNCLMKIEGCQFEEHRLKIDVPTEYQVACALPQPEHGVLVADSYEELIDSPVMASASLTHWSYTEGGSTFHLWINGNEGLKEEDIIPDFQAFTKPHIELFGEFPNPEFHFLIHLLPYPHYHGVEHKNSTVLTLGPTDQIMERKKYRDFTGVASHELFHVWNVTRIRPDGMLPYDLSREIYHPTGYVTEGVTMYYGDLMLVRGGVYSVAEYFEEVNTLLRVHGQNAGKDNLSMIDSSHDLWLDGYTPGAPERRQSIYVEGFVLAFALDFQIRKHTGGQQSLENVMHLMWINFGKKSIAYKDTDFWNCVAITAPNLDLNEYYGQYYEMRDSPLPELHKVLPGVGCHLVSRSPEADLERKFGLRIQQQGATWKVTKLDAQGPAYAQLTHGDEVRSINGQSPDGQMTVAGDEITLEVVRPFEEITVTLSADGTDYLTWMALEKQPDDQVPDHAKEYFQHWLQQPW